MRNQEILWEATEVVLGPAAAVGQLHVNVHREFTLKLRDKAKKGIFQLRAELKGDSVSGKWLPGCQIKLNDTSLELHYEDENALIRAAPCKVTSRDTLTITLKSTETITKGRGFYSLVISNPKEKTTIQWSLEEFHESPPSVRAYASSEDFDLIILKSGVKEPIHESSHQVTYFFTWAEELFK